MQQPRLGIALDVAPSLHPALQHRHALLAQPTPGALIGKGGIGEAVRQHPAPGRQRRLDDLHDVLAPGGKHQQHLGADVHGFGQQQLPQLFTQRRAARFACHHQFMAGSADLRRNRLDMAALAGAIHAFHGDEPTTRGAMRRCILRVHHGFAARSLMRREGAIWNRWTARLCASSVLENSLVPSPRATKYR